MGKKYDYVVYIGRFQPFHDGHANTLKKAYESAHRIIIVIGSANSPRTPKNPWTENERKNMILNAAAMDLNTSRLHFVYAEDRRYKEHKWISYIQSSVTKIAGDSRVAIIGHEKDASSYYIRNNFNWEFVETGPYVKDFESNDKVVSSTKIRELMFENHLGYTQSNLPKPTYDYLNACTKTEIFKELQAEYNEAIREEKVYENLPYGMNFITADSVVVQSGHVLLVKRASYPGVGLWALPGVHVNQNETMQEASIRALIEETHLKIPEKVLKGSLVDIKEFDHPERSLRSRLKTPIARTLTIAYHYELDSSRPLPKNLKAGEGIEQAWWFTFAEVRKMRNCLFEDHADILDYFIG